MRRTHILAWLMLCSLVAAACTSSNSGTSGGACGLTLSGPKWGASCQAWSDQYCCNQEKACAADTGCSNLIACIQACPTPRQDACLNACTPSSGQATDLLNGIGSCSKATPPGGTDIPSSCEWPTG